jgi:hypothetical protein
MADAVVSLASDTVRARQMGRAARASCLEKFGIDRFAESITQFLEEAFPSSVRRRRIISSVALPVPQMAPAPIVAECGVSAPPVS